MKKKTCALSCNMKVNADSPVAIEVLYFGMYLSEKYGFQKRRNNNCNLQKILVKCIFCCV